MQILKNVFWFVSNFVNKACWLDFTMLGLGESNFEWKLKKNCLSI